MMNILTSMRVFRQIVEAGSFVGAAERLEMSTSAVSKYVMQTEKRLGVRLLNRNTRGVSLTELGRIYLERSRGILNELEATELELGSLQSAPGGTLRITAPSFATWQQLPDLVAQHRRRYPEVLIDLSFEDRLVDLMEEGYDLALRIVSSPEELPPGLVARPIRPVAFHLAASREYLKRRGAPKSHEDLAQHDLVAAGSLLNCLSPAGARERGETPGKVMLRYSSVDGVVSAVLSGIGIGPVPSLLFEDPTFKSVLTPIFPERPLHQATMYIVYVSRKFVPLKIRAFVNFIIEATSASSDAKPIVDRPSR